jgi:hypothetical protein
LFSTIDIVSKEEIIFFGRKSSAIEYLEQILKLAVNVAYDFDRGLKFEEHRLLQENIT